MSAPHRSPQARAARPRRDEGDRSSRRRPGRPRAAALLTALALAVLGSAGPAAAQSTTASPTTTTAPPTTTTTPEITAADTPKGILLDPADRVELASSLADATETSGVCFGYEASLGGSGASSQEESLSNFGPDRSLGAASGLGYGSSSFSSDPVPLADGTTPQPVTPEELRTTCPKGALVLNVSLTYTSSSSESNDSASYSVRASDGLAISGSPTARLRDLTGVDDDDLLGDQDDLALRNLAAALPLTLDDATPAADTATTATGPAPNGDRLTGSPGSDWIRAHGLGIGIAFALLVLGIVLVLGGRVGRRQADRPKRPGGSSSTAGDGSSSTTTP